MVVYPTALLETSVFGLHDNYKHNRDKVKLPVDRMTNLIHLENFFIRDEYFIDNNRMLAAQIGCMLNVAVDEIGLPCINRKNKRNNVPLVRCEIWYVTYGCSDTAYRSLAQQLCRYGSGRMKTFDLYKSDFQILFALYRTLKEYANWNKDVMRQLEDLLKAMTERWSKSSKAWAIADQRWTLMALQDS